jgi:hypothetical protein
MQKQMKILEVWQKKDRISRQVETLSESDDWYRGGRKIGKLRRAYKEIETLPEEIESFFIKRIDTAHQTYMDRLSLHKLKGPANQQALKESEIIRISNQSTLLLSAVGYAKEIIANFQSTLDSGKQAIESAEDLKASRAFIIEMEQEIVNNNNRVQVNLELVAVLKSENGFVGCSGGIKSVPA